MIERRCWGRVKASDNELRCQVTEPQELAFPLSCLVDNINPGGLAFLSDKVLPKNLELHLLIKFPFTNYVDAGTVWGRIAYCIKIHDKEKYVVGVAFIKKRKIK
ncbi:MAG: hypothetical protein HQ552_09475 [Desulfobacteraceae bacterium]|nr:hypothetical protein [Desulfobacteraceae bacterium]